MKFIIISSQLIFICTLAFTQEHVNTKDDNVKHHEFKHHRLAVIIGHGHVIGAEDISGKGIVTIPTWGFDYQYWINEKFGLGIKSDIEIMNYVVETDEHSKLERENPYIVSTVFLYHPNKGWNFLAGPGIEIEKNQNLLVIRFGVAYEFELPGYWDFSPEFIFDLKDGNIGAFTWGIGVGKRF